MISNRNLLYQQMCEFLYSTKQPNTEAELISWRFDIKKNLCCLDSQELEGKKTDVISGSIFYFYIQI